MSLENCEELFWQHPIDSLLKFAAVLSQRALPGNYCRPGGVSGTGKASDMKKAAFALATAATLGVTAMVTPSPAQAWRGGWGPGLAGGTNCRRGNRRHSLQRLCLRAGLRLLWRTRLRLLWWTRLRLLWRTKVWLLWRLRPWLRAATPLVTADTPLRITMAATPPHTTADIDRVTMLPIMVPPPGARTTFLPGLVIVRRDAQVEQRKVAEVSATFLCRLGSGYDETRAGFKTVLLRSLSRHVRPRQECPLFRGRSQPVDATLYLRGKRWSAEWNEDFIEVLLRQRRRSCGIAGSAGSR